MSAVVSVPRLRLVRRDGALAANAPDTDLVAAEAPLTLRVEGNPVAVLLRTPGHDRELAAGFLLTEGVIRSRADIFEISLCPSLQDGEGDSGAVDVILTNPAAYDAARLTRHVFTSSSCGACGKTTLEHTLAAHAPLGGDGRSPKVDPELLSTLPAKLRAAQPAFEATGGIHACALFDLSGNLVSLHEDAGRHNALDKLLGAALLAGTPALHDRILLLSGRVSFELVQKALAGRIPVVAALGAPSSFAIRFAESAGITLCGFVGADRLNVYTGAGRLGFPAE